MQTKRSLFTAAIAGLALALSAPAHAEPVANASAAPAGNYAVDTNHMALLARVPHGGFSYEVFRFGGVTGQLTWDPANASANRLNVTVLTNSLQTHVAGFSEELQGQRFLNAAQFPQATFVSSAFRQIDPAHGEVDGTLTIKGVAKPVTFRVELIGAGLDRRGRAVIGARGMTTINAADYSLPGFITGQIELVFEGEFDRQ